MLTATNEFMASKQAIPRLVADARMCAERERRTDTRYPFFRKAVIHLDDQHHSAFTRNISETGIGLMHTVDLPLCNVELYIITDHGSCLKFRARVERCEPSSGGLYISGLTFF
jgi:hypothetical protein